MGMLRVKYINAAALIKTYKVTGDIEAATVIKFAVPVRTGPDYEVSHSLASGKTTANYIREGLYTDLLRYGYLVGRLNSEATATFIKIQTLDLANSTGPSLIIGDNYITDELSDDSDVDADHANFDPVSQAYNRGISRSIPFNNIIGIERTGDTNIKLYFLSAHATTNVITFTPGTVKVAAINTIAVEASDGDNTSSLQEVTITSAFYSKAYNILNKLEEELIRAISSSQGDSLIDLDFDTQNISATIVSG